MTNKENTLAAYSLPRSVSYEFGEMYLLDQTILPGTVNIEKQESIQQVWDSIKVLKVRGAPAIGIAGAYGLLLGVRDATSLPREEFISELKKNAAYLDSARPTAVNLSWGLNRMLKVVDRFPEVGSKELFIELEKEAIQIHEEDKKMMYQIGKNGAELIQEGAGILTHCNAGALAVSELGTALAPIYVAHSNGVPLKVYADETRPLLQGARLTSWELQQSGVDVTLICDNMAAHLMSKGLITMVIVGTDRVAANGDVANKIGTMGVAILANYFNIPFYVACPYSTIDFNTPTGNEIVIEERDDHEVTHFGTCRSAPEGIKVRNPAFDVTPNSLVKGLITEKGIITPPYKENLRSAFTH